MNLVAAIIWTGHNLDEIESFARGHEFSFCVGSNVHRYRWWHRIANRLGFEWAPPDDPTVLEIYPSGPNDRYWTTARVGDFIRHGGEVVRHDEFKEKR